MYLPHQTQFQTQQKFIQKRNGRKEWRNGGRETQKSFCDLHCAGTMSYSSPYLHGTGQYLGHIGLHSMFDKLI